MHVGFHLTHSQLRPGDVVEPGRWGTTIVATGSKHEWYEREHLLETVREQHYPEKPSRLKSAYFFPNYDHALHYWASFAQGDRVYVVTMLDPAAPKHHAYMTCLPPVTGLTDEEVANHYWRADFMVTRGKFQIATEEILTTSPLVVTQEVILTPDMFEDPSAITVDLSARIVQRRHST